MVGLVSVIIPTVKGDKYLPYCIESVKNQTYKDIEIIVVDEGKERSAQRNIGIDRAKGKWLFFLDSDMILHSRVIEACMCTATNKYIPERMGHDKVRDHERQFYTGTCVDAERFVLNTGMKFDEELTGPEDWDYSQRLPQVSTVCKYPLYHVGKHSFEKKQYYAKAMKKYRDKWQGKTDKIKYQLGWRRLLLLMKPRLLLHPILTVKMFRSLWKRYRLLSQHLA